ncbi:biopolymer transporter ExbD [candidate division KSB1 bacterium]|nr:biopolymer transporter ExbD [candidate division KSB1 bacterium]
MSQYYTDDVEESTKLNWQRKPPETFQLKLTSLIDMFTLILVFLLKNFSAEGQIIAMAEDLILPESSSKDKAEAASVIAINHNWILLDGDQVMLTTDVQSVPAGKSITELADALLTRRTIAEGLGQVAEEMDFSGRINIQADKSIPYLIVKKVIETCGKNGYNEIMLAVSETD